MKAGLNIRVKRWFEACLSILSFFAFLGLMCAVIYYGLRWLKNIKP